MNRNKKTQYGPPMNTDERRFGRHEFVLRNRRSSAFIGGQTLFLGRLDS
jgi:hypothetical protein